MAKSKIPKVLQQGNDTKGSKCFTRKAHTKQGKDGKVIHVAEAKVCRDKKFDSNLAKQISRFADPIHVQEIRKGNKAYEDDFTSGAINKKEALRIIKGNDFKFVDNEDAFSSSGHKKLRELLKKFSS